MAPRFFGFCDFFTKCTSLAPGWGGCREASYFLAGAKNQGLAIGFPDRHPPPQPGEQESATLPYATIRPSAVPVFPRPFAVGHPFSEGRRAAEARVALPRGPVVRCAGPRAVRDARGGEGGRGARGSGAGGPRPGSPTRAPASQDYIRAPI